MTGIVLRLRLAAILFFLATTGYGPSVSAQEMVSEPSLRAAMTFNFLKFSEFPPEILAAVTKVRLCLAVSDPLQVEALMALSGRKLWGRELAVVRFAGVPVDCQALYVDSRQRWGTMAEHRGGALLTISAYPGFARERGVIEIVSDVAGTRFDINLGEARMAGIRFSPQLLRLARHVYD